MGAYLSIEGSLNPTLGVDVFQVLHLHLLRVLCLHPEVVFSHTGCWGGVDGALWVGSVVSLGSASHASWLPYSVPSISSQKTFALSLPLRGCSSWLPSGHFELVFTLGAWVAFTLWRLGRLSRLPVGRSSCLFAVASEPSRRLKVVHVVFTLKLYQIIIYINNS